MRDGEILALQLLSDENTQRKYRQLFALSSRPCLIYILLNVWVLNSKATLSKVVGDGAISLPYMDSEALVL